MERMSDEVQIEPYLYRSVVKRIVESPNYVREDDDWNFIYFDMFKKLNRNRCYLWSDGLDDRFSCSEKVS